MKVDPLPLCKKCQEPLPHTVLHCKVCGREAGYPNVRFSETPSEVAALGKRYAAAIADAEARGAAENVAAFEAAVDKSSAIIVMRINRMMPLILSNEAIISYHRMVDAGIRSPANDEWDNNRARNDASINPHSYKDLISAALTLTNKGVRWYGEYHVTLRTEFIDIRSTVFERNPFDFNKKSRSPKMLPKPGSRAKWEDRGKLAVCKLAAAINAATPPDDFPGILLEAGNPGGDSDYIEVSIYGAIQNRAIAKVLAYPNRDEMARSVWALLKPKIEELGAAVEEAADAD